MSGFYGNISNVSKTQMQIDKIYNTRKEMDDNVNLDSVALGRYVLVKYGPEYPSHFHLFENHLYAGYPEPHMHDIAKNGIKPGDKVIILPSFNDGDKTFYHIWKNDNGQLVPGDDTLAGVYEVKDDYSVVKSTAGEGGNYNSHYNLDRQNYGEQRGYNSTVWVKTLDNGVYSYRNIADLNTVMPTFMISVDAPVEDPAKNTPFLTERDDVLYDLHINPAPKFRVKASEGKSDFGNKNIYFNEAGFNVNKKSENTEIEDEIKVEYSGTSGYVYSNGVKAVDTHELSILLPSIGNTISKVWDLVYKPDENGNRNTVIDNDSLFNTNKYDMSTLAGCIRTAQDVLGQDMLVDGLPAADKYAKEYDNSYIYKQDGKYYIIVKKYEPVYSEKNEIISWTEDGYELKEINLNEPINSIFGAMAQMNQELDIVDEKIGAYFTHLDNAVKNLLTFKTFNFNNLVNGNVGSEITIEAQTLSDEITFATSGSLKFENDENVSKQVKLSSI